MLGRCAPFDKTKQSNSCPDKVRTTKTKPPQTELELFFQLHYCPIHTATQTLDIRRGCRAKLSMHPANAEFPTTSRHSAHSEVRGTRVYRGGVQHPAVWPCHYCRWGLPPSRNQLPQENHGIKLAYIPCPVAESRNMLIYSSAEAPCSGHVMPCGASPERRRFSPLACTGLVGFILHPWDRPFTILTQ